MGQAGELKDVGVARSNADHTPSMTTDQQRHVLLNRPHAEIGDGEVVMVTVHLGGTRVEQRPQGDHRLLEPGHTGGGLAQQHANRIVLGLRIAGAQTQHQPTTGQPIDRCGGASQQRRVMKLVVQHQRTHPQTCRGLGGDHQRYERVDGADVVEREQLLVAQRFRLAGCRNQTFAVAEIPTLQCESEGPGHARDPKRPWWRRVGRR